MFIRNFCWKSGAQFHFSAQTRQHSVMEHHVTEPGSVGSQSEKKNVTNLLRGSNDTVECENLYCVLFCHLSSGGSGKWEKRRRVEVMWKICKMCTWRRYRPTENDDTHWWNSYIYFYNCEVTTSFILCNLSTSSQKGRRSPVRLPPRCATAAWIE